MRKRSGTKKDSSPIIFVYGKVTGPVLEYLMDEIDYLAVVYYNKDNRKDNSILNRFEEIGRDKFL